MLRRSFNPAVTLRRFDNMIGAVRASGAEVIVFRFADVTSRLPGKRLISPRMAILDRAVGEVAERHGAVLVDLWRADEFHNPRLWSEDRLHMSAAGHRRVAAYVLAALGVDAEAEWHGPPDVPGSHQ